MEQFPLTAETILFRLALAALLGTIIGFEREVHGRSWSELQASLRRLEDLTRIHWAEGEVR
jgi:hypothetical protein